MSDVDGAGRRRLVPYGLALAATLLVSGLVHGPSIAANLGRHHWEDWRFFRHNRTHIHSLLDCFTQPSAWPGLYRPLTTNCYYLAGRALWHNRIEAYHLVNAVLYVANALLLFWIARRLLPDALALLAVVIWSSRLAHRQLLLYTSEFQGLFSTFLSLLALGLALWRVEEGDGPPAGTRRRESLALFAFAAALLSKESSVVLPAIVSAATWLYAPRAWKRDLPWWGLAASWAALFALVLRGVSGYAPTGFAYDFSAAVGTRYVAYALMLFNAVLRPVDDWSVPARVPLMAAHAWVIVPMAVAAAALLALLAAARRLEPGRAGAPQRVMGLGLVWFLAGTAPYVIFADRLFLRYAYFGSAGLALVLAALPAVVAEWWRVRRRPEEAGPAATAPTSAPAPP